MRVEDKPSVKAADSAPAKQSPERALVRLQADKVSVEGARQVEAVVQAVQTTIRAATDRMSGNWRKESCKPQKSMRACAPFSEDS